MKRLLYLMMILIFLGCINFDDELTIKKTPYTSENLKINGYYYNTWKVDSSTFIQINFLYRNGVFFNGSADDSIKINDLEQLFKSGIYYKNSFNRKYAWGTFIVEGDSIFIERWYAPRPY
jgi:hypothetical protein